MCMHVSVQGDGIACPVCGCAIGWWCTWGCAHLHVCALVVVCKGGGAKVGVYMGVQWGCVHTWLFARGCCTLCVCVPMGVCGCAKGGGCKVVICECVNACKHGDM